MELFLMKDFGHLQIYLYSFYMYSNRHYDYRYQNRYGRDIFIYIYIIYIERFTETLFHKEKSAFFL